ncbi:MAG: tetratricopeptide repeat protein [Syntrophales bacterium]
MIKRLKSVFVLRGFLLLAIFTPLLFLPQVWDLYTLPKECFVRLIVSLLVVTWAFENISSKKSGIYFSPLGLPILLYTLTLFLSLIYTINPYTGAYEIFRQLTCVFLFFLVINYVETEKDILNICGAAVLGGLLVSILGIFQYFTSFNPDWLYQVARPSATFGNKNMAAEYVIMVIPLSLILFLKAGDERPRLLWAVAAIEMIAYTVYANSRGAWLGLALGGLITLLIQTRRHKGQKTIIEVIKKTCASPYPRFHFSPWRASLLIFLLSLHLIFPYILPTPAKLAVSYRDKMSSALDLSSDSASSRLAVWANTLEMIKDHPFGVGINNWKVVYPEYTRSRIIDKAATSETHFEEAHNDYLQMMAEIGIGGFVFYLWILTAIVRMCWKSPDTKYSPFFLWSIVGFMITSLFSFPSKMPVTSLFFWLAAGLIVVRSRMITPSGRWRIMEGGKIFNLSFLGFSVIWLISMVFLSYLQTFSNYYLHRANILLTGDRNEDAIAAYSRSAELNPFYYWTYFGRAKAQYRLNNFAASIEDNLHALNFYPHDINAHGNLGLAYAEKGLFDLAGKEYRKVLKLYPEDKRALYRMKELDQKRTSYLEAKTACEKSQASSPDSAETRNYRGYLCFLTGSYDEAISWYRKAIVIDNRYAQAHHNLANAYSKKGLIDPAIEEYERAIRINPDLVQAYIDLGNACKEKGLFKTAVEMYLVALRLKPDDADIHFSLGEIYLTCLYDKEQALFHLKKTLTLNPQHPRAEQIIEVIKILTHD